MGLAEVHMIYCYWYIACAASSAAHGSGGSFLLCITPAGGNITLCDAAFCSQPVRTVKIWPMKEEEERDKEDSGRGGGEREGG